MNVHAHLMADWDLRPRQIAAHLREVHKVEPKQARKGMEREVWYSQHDDEHHEGVSGFRQYRPGHLAEEEG